MVIKEVQSLHNYFLQSTIISEELIVWHKQFYLSIFITNTYLFDLKAIYNLLQLSNKDILLMAIYFFTVYTPK